MWQLYQFPLCPFSRKVRLMLAEKGVAHELVRESPWEKRDVFADLNPAGKTPVLVEESRGIVLIDSGAICEYFEETVDKMPMIHGNAVARAEIRRLTVWFDEEAIAAPGEEETIEIAVAGRQFYWEFRYPDGTATDATYTVDFADYGTEKDITAP